MNVPHWRKISFSSVSFKPQSPWKEETCNCWTEVLQTGRMFFHFWTTFSWQHENTLLQHFYHFLVYFRQQHDLVRLRKWYSLWLKYNVTVNLVDAILLVALMRNQHNNPLPRRLVIWCWDLGNNIACFGLENIIGLNGGALEQKHRPPCSTGAVNGCPPLQCMASVSMSVSLCMCVFNR